MSRWVFSLAEPLSAASNAKPYSPISKPEICTSPLRLREAKSSNRSVTPVVATVALPSCNPPESSTVVAVRSSVAVPSSVAPCSRRRVPPVETSCPRESCSGCGRIRSASFLTSRSEALSSTSASSTVRSVVVVCSVRVRPANASERNTNGASCVSGVSPRKLSVVWLSKIVPDKSRDPSVLKSTTLKERALPPSDRVVSAFVRTAPESARSPPSVSVALSKLRPFAKLPPAFSVRSPPSRCRPPLLTLTAPWKVKSARPLCNPALPFRAKVSCTVNPVTLSNVRVWLSTARLFNTTDSGTESVALSSNVTSVALSVFRLPEPPTVKSAPNSTATPSKTTVLSVTASGPLSRRVLCACSVPAPPKVMPSSGTVSALATFSLAPVSTVTRLAVFSVSVFTVLPGAAPCTTKPAPTSGTALTVTLSTVFAPENTKRLALSFSTTAWAFASVPAPANVRV